MIYDSNIHPYHIWHWTWESIFLVVLLSMSNKQCKKQNTSRGFVNEKFKEKYIWVGEGPFG